MTAGPLLAPLYPGLHSALLHTETRPRLPCAQASPTRSRLAPILSAGVTVRPHQVLAWPPTTAPWLPLQVLAPTGPLNPEQSLTEAFETLSPGSVFLASTAPAPSRALFVCPSPSQNKCSARAAACFLAGSPEAGRRRTCSQGRSKQAGQNQGRDPGRTCSPG